MKLPIYLDNQATTRVDPRVVDAMLPYFSDDFGNAASRTHVYGWRSAEAVEMAREQIAEAIGAASPKEVVFTSGATESNNLAIKGLAGGSFSLAASADAPSGTGSASPSDMPSDALLGAAGSGTPPSASSNVPAGSSPNSQSRRHLVVSAIEHSSVLDPCRALAAQGLQLTELGVDAAGQVDPADLEQAITDETVLVSILLVNNEIGVVQPLAKIAEASRRREVLLHTDAAQAVGKIPLDVQALGVDLMSFTAHKLYGPKGIGALYVRKKLQSRLKRAPLIHGGGHEQGMRSGTLPVPLIVGFAKALELCQAELTAESERLVQLRERLWQQIHTRLSGVHLNGHPQERLPGNLNLSFDGISGDALLPELHEVALSSGAACASATPEPSHVLSALGLSEDLVRSALRFGIGRFNTSEEIDRVADHVVEVVARLRRGA